MYVDTGKDVVKDEAVLVAKYFPTEAKETARVVKEKHGVKIQLLTLSELNIDYYPGHEYDFEGK